MNYQQTIDYLFSQTANYERQGDSGYKPGLANMMALDERLGHPHRHYRTIHVAGTNGKGSVSHTLAAILQAWGFKVGLYTSPHLVDFCERIRIDGKTIPEDYVTTFTALHKSFFDQLQPSFFEIATSMAFKYFSDMDIDIAVVEVGLGGRLDSTNIITPVLSIITNISLDHTQMLGSTLAEIAGEKAGVMKAGVSCIVGEAVEETRPVFDRMASQKGAHLVYAQDAPRIVCAEPLTGRPGMHYTTASGMTFDGELAGSFQAQNANTVLCAIETLIAEEAIPRPQIREQLERRIGEAFGNVSRTTGLRGRWQTLGIRPTVICDIGHNEGAWHYLGPLLKQINCPRMHIVFGMLADKDTNQVMSLLPHNASYYFTSPQSHRALTAQQLLETARRYSLEGTCYPSVREAYNAAVSHADADDFIFVGGSNYVVSEVLKTDI